MKITKCFELQILNDFMELGRMTEWIRNAGESMALPESLVWNFDLCANEAITNIISYAYKDDDRHYIDMRFELTENEVLRLSIQDDGIPFNPFEALPPTPYDTFENAQIGGLGIHLIRSLMDECHYCRPNGKNITTLCAAISQTTARPLSTTLDEMQHADL